MWDGLDGQMRKAAYEGRTADMNGLLDRGAEVNSTDRYFVSRPSAAAGLAPPPQAPEAPSAPLAPAAAARPPPPTAALALGRPAAGCSLSALPLHGGSDGGGMPPRRAGRRSTTRLPRATMTASALS